ncbi:hypothetical protein BDN70DRAFT_935764 [Pholiota conissans]|uniref:Uncharacterized protein n=1 Tax=Pholiota conissans TaxID=109636 RepID=A0A9P5YUW3_9AGAR|nr:hypothetical protein BDN70DRAFT_935764 [Pholiota conissans]
MSSGTYTVASYNPVNDAESNFGNRLTNYYVTADRCMERVQRQFPAARTEDLRKRYDAVLLAFYNDPVKNPLTLPTTSREIKYFLKKCDECTLINPDSVHIDECLRMICVVNHGVQFIT